MGAGLTPLVLALAGWLGAAKAEEPLPWYLGQPVAGVGLVNQRGGGLPEGDLAPLLRVGDGAPLTAADLRRDIVLLARAGGFSEVSAEVEPWVMFGEDGLPVSGVYVRYLVASPPRVARVVVKGVRGRARRITEDAHGLVRGEPIFEPEDVERTRARVSRALVGAGYSAAQVQVEVSSRRSARQVNILVEAGEQRTFGEVRLTGDLVLPERQIRRVLRRAGVASGRAVIMKEVQSAGEHLRDALVAEGFLRAHVNLIFVPDAHVAGTEHVNVVVDSRSQVTFKAKGAGLPSDTALPGVLGWYPGHRVTDREAEDATAALQRWFDDRGFLDAKVEVQLSQLGEHQHLDIQARRGPRHLLRRLQPGFRRARVRFEGAQQFADSFLALAVAEAAADSLGDGFVSPAGLETGREAVAGLYRGLGHLAAEIETLPSDRGRRRFNLLRLGSVVPVVPAYRVVEGPQTRLGDLRTSGGLGLENTRLTEAEAEMVGGPYSRARLDRLALEFADLYRESGYVQADVRVEVTLLDDGALAQATLLVEPGPQVRLRAVVVQGLQRTRRKVVDRELEVEVGQPITPSQLDRSRRRLYELDLFRAVDPVLVGEDERTRDLLLTVEEKRNILLEAGGGVSTDQGATLRVRATHRNLRGLGQRLSALGQVGYGWFGEEWRLDVAEPTWKAAAQYEAPYVPGRGQRLLVEALVGEVVAEPTYRLSRSGGAVGIRFRNVAALEAFIDYRVEFRRLADVDPGALVSGDPWLGPLGFFDARSAPATPSDVRIAAGPSFSIVHDLRDDRFNPSSGRFATLALTMEDALLGESMFVRALARIEQLLPIGGPTLALGARLGGGWVAAKDATLPIEERFYLGGASTLRGFGLDQAGPSNFTGRPDIGFPDQVEPVIEQDAIREDTAHWVPTGGDYLVALRGELRVPMPLIGLSRLDSTSWVFFGDAGRVGFASRAVQTSSIAEGRDPLLRYGVGSGVRVASPIGPISLDLAFNPEVQYDREESFLRLHLSLGAL